MRILVISDSHRNTRVIDKILESQPDAKHVFFLGDCTADIEDFDLLYPDKTFHIVCGNCDFYSSFKSVDVDTVCGHRIFFTHGHNYAVKSSYQHLLKTTKENNCDIALFGHTHIPKIVYEEGVYLVNPGSCSKSREGRPTYAVIDITDKGIMPFTIEIS